jgi:hypothetical protein
MCIYRVLLAAFIKHVLSLHLYLFLLIRRLTAVSLNHFYALEYLSDNVKYILTPGLSKFKKNFWW